MSAQLATELFLSEQPGSSAAVEHVCAIATSRPEGDAIAVAVAPANVSRAADLLFGTGIGIVSALGDGDPHDLVALARFSVATGATEVALPRLQLDEAVVLRRLKSFLGSSTPVTVDITSPTGDVDLSKAEHALVLGADYVSFAPQASTMNPAHQTANLVELACEVQRGGVKVASGSDHHLTVLRSYAWAMSPGNARHCLAVSSPGG